MSLRLSNNRSLRTKPEDRAELLRLCNNVFPPKKDGTLTPHSTRDLCMDVETLLAELGSVQAGYDDREMFLDKIGEVIGCEWGMLEELLAAVRKLADAARIFVAKAERIMDSDAYRSVWTIAHIHHAPYQGETWEAEFKELKAAVAKAQPQQL